jgi:hypothetical protein
MKEIQLTKGKIAFVDDADYEELNGYKWRLMPRPNGRFHVYRKKYIGAGKSVTIYLHQHLMGTYGTGIQVDHRDGDGLNNQRDNLRKATNQQNQFNRHTYAHQNNSSKYKGVHLRKDTKKWSAQIKINQKVIRLGCFESETEAALAYNVKAKELFGEFACLNQLPSTHESPEISVEPPHGQMQIPGPACLDEEQ